MMKKLVPILLLMTLLASCDGWVLQPLPNNAPTPFLPFTQTPSVFTSTPVVIGVASATPAVSTPTASVTLFPSLTSSPTAPVVAFTNTAVPVSGAALAITVLGCNTSIDITHGMGEVTNAFVTLKNIGSVGLTNIQATLFAGDPGAQVHPDTTVELTSLLTGYQVTIKLTVDSTYRQETPIQIEVTSNQVVFPREGSASCRDIGVLAPNPGGLKTPIPITP